MRIDMHVHIGYALGWDMTEDMVLKSMERYNIDYSIVSNTESVRYDHNFKEVPKRNATYSDGIIKKKYRLCKKISR